MKNISDFFCFNCGHITKTANLEAKNIVCSFCGYPIESETYKQIIEFSEETVVIGFLYRKQYEMDYKKDKALSKRYCLSSPPDVLIYIGSVIVSGIIGNYSYDVIKKVISKIREQYQPTKKDSHLETVEKILSDDVFKDELTLYIKEYLEGMPDVNSKIREAVFSELFVHDVQEIMKIESEKITKPEDIDKRISKYRKIRLSKRTKVIKLITKKKDFWGKF